MKSNTEPTIKDVHSFWSDHVNNEYYTKEDRGSEVYFKEIEQKRYAHHYHLVELFDEYRNPSQDSNKLLEIGCSAGVDTVQWYKAGYDVTAVDLTEAAIAIAKERAEREGYDIDYRVANAEELNIPENTYDKVYSFGVLHHTPDIQKSIDEVNRILKPEGKAIIMLYAKYSLVNFIHRLFSLPYESPRNLKDHCPVVYTYSKKELEELFSNFKNIELRKTYPFTYGFRFISSWLPVSFKKFLGNYIGWHWMIIATK